MKRINSLAFNLSHCFFVWAFVSFPLVAWAKIYRFDFGDTSSPVQENYIAVTPKSFYPEAEAGWRQAEKLEARNQAYTEFQDSSRGKVPPPVWTTALSQDQIVSAEPAEFVAKVEPGTYKAWIFCGTSTAYRSQYFDFEIHSGSDRTRVQFENSYQYRDAYLTVPASEGEAHIHFQPHSLWIVAGIVLWQEGEEAQVRQHIIGPEREVVDNMPPEEFAKWKFVPRVVETSPWPPITESDKKRGYIVHQRHWADVVYPDTVPIASEINPTLRAFASLGEYEPLTVCIYPLRDFAGVSIEVSDLKSASSLIPASQIEVRRAKYMRVRPNYTVLYQYRWAPDPLMPFDPEEPLIARQNARFWLTVHVPAQARPGIYRGTITLTPKGAASHRVPLIFRVLPIRLQEDPTKIYGIYYRDPLDDWDRAKDEVSKAYYLRKSEWEMQDLVAHGTRNVTTSLWSPPEKEGQIGSFSFNFDLFQKKVERWRKYGFKFPLVVAVNASGIYRKYMKEDLGSHCNNAKLPPPEYGAELTRMCQAIEAERVRRGWPEFLYYPIDEPSTAPGSIAFMIETLKAVRAAGVKTYVTADPTKEGFAPLKPYVDVWCTQPFLPPREELLKEKAARNVDFWCYPNHVNGENDHTTVNGARMTYGFGFWRSGFTALIPWIYRADIGNPWNYLDGSASDFFNRTEDNGRPIPVAMWEAYREGYDDYRYIYTLQEMIKAAQKRGDKAAQAAAQAQAALDWIWQQIRVQPKYKYDDLWEPREIDVYRWIIANAILKLQEAGVSL